MPGENEIWIDTGSNADKIGSVDFSGCGGDGGEEAVKLVVVAAVEQALAHFGIEGIVSIANIGTLQVDDEVRKTVPDDDGVDRSGWWPGEPYDDDLV